MGKLTSIVAGKVTKAGLTPDGGGLYLSVRPSTDGGYNRSWVVRYAGADGKRREAGLGRFPDVSLATARERAAEIRSLAASGKDPLVEREIARAAAKIEAARLTTFKDCAEAYVRAHEETWSNAKHAWQWTNTLRKHAYPVLGDLPVNAVDSALVLKVLDPIWSKTPETANRLRGRIELVLSWAKARGLREGDNPAAWRGNLQHALPAPGKVRPRGHHAALPIAKMPGFYKDLDAIHQMSARALAFTILTAARTSEVLGAKWEEFDLAARVWTVPAGRMKGKREHRVPLSEEALRVLGRTRAPRAGDFVFEGVRFGRPLSNMSMLMLLRRMGHAELTAHGFRSTFRDWCAEHTNWPREVAEAALAHIVADKVEAAYRRGDLLEKRAQMMNQWGDFVTASLKLSATQEEQARSP
jgi:integrase